MLETSVPGILRWRHASRKRETGRLFSRRRSMAVHFVDRYLAERAEQLASTQQVLEIAGQVAVLQGRTLAT